MTNNSKKTVVVAMSGGVDSSVAAALLKEQGYNLIGITMKTWGFDDFPVKDSGCCSLEAIYNARNVATNLGIPHYTFDFTERFNETVIENFIAEYMKGQTPNPCVLCNKTIKWGVLLDRAKELGADYISTGHYAKVNNNGRRYFVSNSSDVKKDQTYALWQVSQEALSKTLFPLGEYTKPEIRKMAESMGLKTANEPDSQEICFVPNNDYRELLEIRIPDLKKRLEKGEVIYKDKKIGEHKGFPYYTIGQRKGLNLSLGKPIYVTKIDAENNKVFVDDEIGLYKKGFIAREINFMKYDSLNEPIKSNVKIRYKDNGSTATLNQLDSETIEVIFDVPKKSITPGQSAVFYEGDDVIGGGIIRDILE
jgi:tRNA-specific 2-thiouridylase